MRIGINLLWLIPGYGGLETYARGLIAGLAQTDSDHQYVLFTNPLNHRTFDHLPAVFTRRICRLPQRSRITWRIVEQFLLPRFSAREKLDLLHAPADLVPVGRRCPIVVTIHDVNFYSLSDPLPISASRLFESWVRRSARSADGIITVSEFSRSEIVSRLRISADRISVVHNAPAIRRKPSPSQWPGVARRLGVSGNYIITFADGSPHKNLATLIRAFATLAPKYPLQLVVVGEQRRHDRAIGALLNERNLNNSVIFAGYLGEDELSLTLGNARMMAFPSLYEGFGLPVIEAMAAGVPVACSQTTALPEVAGKAAAFFSPSSADDIALTIDRVLSNESLRSDLIAAGYRQALRFSWNRAAQQTVEVYERILRGTAFTAKQPPVAKAGSSSR